MEDPLQLAAQRSANDIRLSRAASHPEIERLYARLMRGGYGDSLEIRVLLLAHMTYIAYRDIKETFSL